MSSGRGGAAPTGHVVLIIIAQQTVPSIVSKLLNRAGTCKEDYYRQDVELFAGGQQM